MWKYTIYLENKEAIVMCRGLPFSTTEDDIYNFFFGLNITNVQVRHVRIPPPVINRDHLKKPSARLITPTAIPLAIALIYFHTYI